MTWILSESRTAQKGYRICVSVSVSNVNGNKTLELSKTRLKRAFPQGGLEACKPVIKVNADS